MSVSIFSLLRKTNNKEIILLNSFPTLKTHKKDNDLLRWANDMNKMENLQSLWYR